MKSTLVPPPAKGALAIGKVLVKLLHLYHAICTTKSKFSSLYNGVEAYVETRDLSQVGKVVQDSTIKW